MKRVMTKMILFGLIMTALWGCKKKESTYPQRKNILDVVFASGNVVKSNEYLVTANADGFLIDVYVSEGDTVTKDALLFKLSNEIQNLQVSGAQINYNEAISKNTSHSPEITQFQIQITQAKEQAQLDKNNYDRYSTLIKTNAVSQADYEKARLQYESSQNNLRLLQQALNELKRSLSTNLKMTHNQLQIQQEAAADYELKANINGRVLNVFKEQGELVRRGETIAKLGGGSTLIKLFIAEEDIKLIRLGQQVKVTLNTDENQIYEASVSKIYPAFDPQEQSFIAEATFNDQTRKLFVGTQLQANIIVNDLKNTLVIPSAYLLPGNKVQLKKEQQPVEVGIKNIEWVSITKGLDITTKIFLPKQD